jgi:hypothetical protein
LVIYLLSAVVAMLHSYVKATPEERVARGLNFMLFGVAMGITPLLLAVIVGVLAPKVVLPGVEFYQLATVLIPFSVARAVLKQERANTPVPVAA